MLALMAPYFLRKERESGQRHDEKPRPISPARVRMDPDRWLDTAHLSAPPDPVTDRQTMPPATTAPTPAVKGQGKNYALVFGVSGLLTLVGLIIFLCSQRRPKPRNVRDVTTGHLNLTPLK